MAAGARGGDSAVPDAGEEDDGRERCVGCVSGGGDEEVCAVGEEEENDRAAFLRLLQKVSLAEAKVYSKMSYLCNFAYMVSRIKSDPTIKAIVNGEHAECLTIDEASFVAPTNSMTSIVAAKEETKKAVADDLNSSGSCPCEWFICDDNQSITRYFVVQGSETIASWQANLLFEPIKFEGLNVPVHRGIYEAAKGIYQQVLPYVKSHLRSHGKSARLRFTGHSLGGSLALLVNLKLWRSVRAVVRKEMRAERERWRLLWWPIEVHGVAANLNWRQVSRLLQRHAHLLVVFLLPVKLLVQGVLSVIRAN